jgi:hypothetical protein
MEAHTKEHVIVMVSVILITAFLLYFAYFCHPDVELDIRHTELQK